MTMQDRFPCVEVDYNQRSAEDLVRAGFEDVRGGPIFEGLVVPVTMPDDESEGLATVVRIDDEARLIYLEVDWSTVRHVRRDGGHDDRPPGSVRRVHAVSCFGRV